MASWHCDLCNSTIKASSKYAHIRSKKHLERVKEPEPPKTPEPSKTPTPEPAECLICLESLIQPTYCKKCNQGWCSTCDSNIHICPYCRVPIKGREDQAQEQQRQIHNWYASSSAFDPNYHHPNIDITILDFLMINGFIRIGHF